MVDAELRQEFLVSGTIDFVAQQWLAKLKNADAKKPAREIYCGRGFRESEASSLALSCPLYVVSAGLGIVNADMLVPVYDLSAVSSDGDSALCKVDGNKSPKLWWSKIITENSFGSSLTNILNKHPNELILFALSRCYLNLLQDELLLCPQPQQARLRFFGKNLYSALPSFLTDNWMPYDDRLDGIGQGFSGTQSDFAQRALRHFVSKILSESKDSNKHRHSSMVLNSLSSITKREIPKRQRLDEKEISKVIQDNWVKGKGQSSLLLRIIRDELNIACEQSRFKKIYHSVRNTIGEAS
ncbi:hypothetical protein [Ferrovum myxofaciens]|uniref:hypothetical protein n=1 Tax=Ferrovum myxofaciens TaxID=416213 RepID=UPI001AF67852|nr:hypothetical protein [Ferrovum myxofaciens]QKE37676.2 MAG: hypothetical protein HO273_02115 [Ferrovum myxofaciens]QWY75336.1 MAG: hypothetical protein JVY19_02550 [Ferrovum myxofaciens]